MSFHLLQLPVEVVQQVIGHLCIDSKRSMALALGGRPRPGDGASEQHVRDLQRLLLPTKIFLDIDDEDLSPESLPESESGAAARDLAHAQIRRHSAPHGSCTPGLLAFELPVGHGHGSALVGLVPQQPACWACRRAPASDTPAH
jgi:hypothetical protein